MAPKLNDRGMIVQHASIITPAQPSPDIASQSELPTTLEVPPAVQPDSLNLDHPESDFEEPISTSKIEPTISEPAEVIYPPSQQFLQTTPPASATEKTFNVPAAPSQPPVITQNEPAKANDTLTEVNSRPPALNDLAAIIKRGSIISPARPSPVIISQPEESIVVADPLPPSIPQFPPVIQPENLNLSHLESDFEEPDESIPSVRPQRTREAKEVGPEPRVEGKRVARTSYAAVRDSKLKAMAIQVHGRNCVVCGFNFDSFFGEDLSQGYIEVHHLSQISEGERTTDPVTDLAPLCANCHAMADRLTRRTADLPSSIAGLREMLIPSGRVKSERKVETDPYEPSTTFEPK